MKSLFTFENVDEFHEFITNRKVLSNWYIKQGDLEDRAKYLSNKKFFVNLKNAFEQNDLFYKTVSNSEVISWCDTLSIMNEVFDEDSVYMEELSFGVNKKWINSKFHDGIKIVMEYRVPYFNHSRIDYILCFKDKLLIVEFSSCQNKKDLSKKVKKKYNEAMVYKDMLANYISEGVKIGTYAFCYLPEIDNDREEIEDNILINNKSKQEFVAFMNEFFSRNDIAFNELMLVSYED